jgi:hypothetical protein
MANTRPTVDTPPSATTAPDRRSGRLGGLGQLLDARLAFGQAQGMLAELTGCSLAGAGEVLLQVGAQLGLESADGVAEFFLIAVATAPGGPEAQAFIRQARNSARSAQPSDPASTRHTDDEGGLRDDDRLSTDAFATLMPGGRRLIVRGELDIATAPLLVSSFNDHDDAISLGTSFVLDLHDLTFVDLYGVRALSDLQVQIAAAGYELRVDPPAHLVIRRTLQFAVRSGWLVPAFADTAPWLR